MKINSLEDLVDPELLNIVADWIKRNNGLENIGSIFALTDIINENNIEKNILWHYTKLNVLEEMLQPKKVNIRFTNTKYLNDSSEGKLFKPFLTKNKEQILENLLYKDKRLAARELTGSYKMQHLREDFEEDFFNEDSDEFTNGSKIRNFYESYVFSMSRLKDSFAFWNKSYAGTDGVAIGFKRNKIEIEKSLKILDVVYIEPDYKVKIADDIVIEYVTQLVILFYNKYHGIPNGLRRDCLIEGFSALFKRRPWQYEQETRMLLSSKPKDKNEKIMCLGNRFVKFNYKLFNKDVIKSIMLGPACGDEQVEAVSHYLERNGYNNIEVSRSKAFDLRYGDE